MDEYEKQYPIDPIDGEAMYEEMYYNDAQAQFMEELAGLDPQQRAAHIQQMKAMAAANGELDGGYDSEDDALFFDNNDLANRIWEDNELEQDA